MALNTCTLNINNLTYSFYFLFIFSKHFKFMGFDVIFFLSRGWKGAEVSLALKSVLQARIFKYSSVQFQWAEGWGVPV